MKVLIHEARIIDPASTFHGNTVDILVDSGKIAEIGTGLSAQADHHINTPGLLVSPGWVDIFSNFNDPGYEFKETLETGAFSAAAGGFTDVFVVPNTKPAIDSKSQVEYILHKSAKLPSNIHPLGAISRGTLGKELAEMYDMASSGAIAFTDGTEPIQSAGLLLKALQYLRAIDAIAIQIPDDKTVGSSGLMDEGIISTRLGLAGKPMIAEELLVARDLKLARYADSKIHFTGISSPKSLEYIRRAKEGGIQVTCSVTPYHLFFTDKDLWEYDTNLKVYPPLRSENAVDALMKAVLDGTVDCIATHHFPHETDSKELEFEYAKFGMIGLETCFGALRTALPSITDERLIELLSSNPRRIFSLKEASIDRGQTAILTLFTNEPSAVESSKFYSRSRNSAFAGKTLNGTVKGIINEEKLFLK